MSERADPRDDLYQVAALLAELDRVLNPLAPEERGELVSTPAMPPPLPPVSPRGAPPRSSGPAAPPRRMLGSSAAATPVVRTAQAPTAATVRSPSTVAPSAPRVAPAPPAARRSASPQPPTVALGAGRADASPTAPGGSSAKHEQPASGTPARPDTDRPPPARAEDSTGATGRSTSNDGPALARRAPPDRARPPRRRSIARADAETPATRTPPAIPRARPKAPSITDEPRSSRELRDDDASPSPASWARHPAPPRRPRAIASSPIDRDATISVPARRATPVSPRFRDRTARSAGLSSGDHGNGPPARGHAPHAARGSERPALPRAPSLALRDGARRLGDPIAPPPLPRSKPVADRARDRRLDDPPLDEPAEPAADPFVDRDDPDDRDGLGDDDDDPTIDGRDSAAAPPVTLWLRGGRVRVPISAAAVARADRRLSRLGRKRGRRL
jgi:hypothetical protein